MTLVGAGGWWPDPQLDGPTVLATDLSVIARWPLVRQPADRMAVTP